MRTSVHGGRRCAVDVRSEREFSGRRSPKRGRREFGRVADKGARRAHGREVAKAYAMKRRRHAGSHLAARYRPEIVVFSPIVPHHVSIKL